MGLFDIFRGKNGQSNSKNTKWINIGIDLLTAGKNKEDVVATLKTLGIDPVDAVILAESAMGIFNKNTNNSSQKSAQNIEHKANTLSSKDAPSVISDSGIEIASRVTGGHGDNLGALFGFENMQSSGMRQSMMEYMALAMIQPPVLENPIVKICDVSIPESLKLTTPLHIRTIIAKDEFISAYPYIPTQRVLPFETKSIVEWKHAANMEAELLGGGWSTFGIGFFATDYAVNKKHYKANKKVNIHLTALALVMEETDIKEINGTPVGDDFTAFLPNKQFESRSYYDFLGIVHDYTPVKISDANSGYMMSVQLITDLPETGNHFIVDMFVNQQNMRFHQPEKGMKIAGALWFQGALAL
jgi:hypothetical protein